LRFSINILSEIGKTAERRHMALSDSLETLDNTHFLLQLEAIL